MRGGEGKEKVRERGYLSLASFWTSRDVCRAFMSIPMNYIRTLVWIFVFLDGALAHKEKRGTAYVCTLQEEMLDWRWCAVRASAAFSSLKSSRTFSYYCFPSLESSRTLRGKVIGHIIWYLVFAFQRLVSSLMTRRICAVGRIKTVHPVFASMVP